MLGKYFKNEEIPGGVEIEDAIMTVTEKEKAIVEKPFEKKNLQILWILLLVISGLLLGRVFYLDILRGAYYKEVSEGNRIRTILIKAPRGKILDKSGNVLVHNASSVDAIIIPGDLPSESEEKNKILEELSKILEIEENDLKKAVNNQPEKSLNPILVKENITRDQILIISEKASVFPGVVLENTAIRNYENSVIFSSFIGYDGKITKEELADNPGYFMTDYIGKSGLEKQYEKELRGVHGANQVEVDAKGNIKKNLGIISPVSGADLMLNIDESLQKKIYDSLAANLEKTGTKTAAAVAIDPRNGGILAMVSLPSFDNNLFARGISQTEYNKLIQDKNLPLFNRAVDGEYPPGSTFKMAVALAALSEKTVSPETTVNDSSGSINLGVWRFGDWKTHGVVDMRKAIAESCDVYFYALGGGYGNIPGLGINKMKNYAALLGLGKPTGVDLPSEATGFLPDEEWKMETLGEKWYIGDSYHSAIGQGFITATPIQIANYVAAIANGGTLYSPRLVAKIKKNNNEEQILRANILRKNFIAEDLLKVVREGMRQTVVSGSARSLSVLPVPVAGKTGTAQFGSEGKTHAWFASFAPYDNPEIALVILAEGGGEGSSTAVPVAKEVLEWYFKR
jgi:penicillin-binding protein 2